jgi:hypothetical protein
MHLERRFAKAPPVQPDSSEPQISLSSGLESILDGIIPIISKLLEALKENVFETKKKKFSPHDDVVDIQMDDLDIDNETFFGESVNWTNDTITVFPVEWKWIQNHFRERAVPSMYFYPFCNEVDIKLYKK